MGAAAVDCCVWRSCLVVKIEMGGGAKKVL